MKCAICRNGETEMDVTTVVFERGETTLVFKHVPAEICTNCGEEYLSAEMNRNLMEQAEREYRRGVALEMLDYAVQSSQTEHQLAHAATPA